MNVRWGSITRNDPAAKQMRVCRFVWIVDDLFANQYGVEVRGKYWRNDVALLILQSPVKLDDVTKLVSLSYEYPIPETVMSIYGFGRIEGQPFSNKLRTANMTVASQEICEELIIKENRENRIFAFDKNAYFCLYSDRYWPGDGDSGLL